MCHSAHPTHPGVSVPPLGLDFTDDATVKRNVARILFKAVTTQAMPLGHEPQMTDDERDTLGAWIRQGAPIQGAVG